MSLIGALNIGRSALAVNQAALQVTGNNIANAGNADYTRQVANVASAGDQSAGPGVSLGMGIDLTSVQRQIDDALESRLRSSISDDNSASTTKQWLDRVESVFNELGDQDLSTQMSTFFNSWSKLADNPLDPSQRSIVLQNGQSLAGWIQNVRSDLTSVQQDLGSSIKSLVTNADSLAGQVATLNKQIAATEGSGGGTANSLRDQRDAVLKQLSGLVDVHVSDGNNGMVNVFIGSEPLVMNDTSRGLTTKDITVNGQATVGVAFKTGGATAPVTGGQIGAMVGLQSGQLQSTIDQLDSLAGNLINELNKVYSQGQGADADGLQGYTSLTSTNAVTDPNAALNDPASGLKFKPTNGSFTIAVYDTTAKQYVSTLVPVDLDGIGGNDTTLTSLAANINANVPGVSATITAGKLTIKATAPNSEVLFGSDSSGALASLGLNTFFTGTDATNIGVNQAVLNNSSLLATTGNWQPGGNSVATAINGMPDQTIAALGGRTLDASYSDMINQTAVAAANAQNNSDAASTVRQTLESQRESLSGVDMNEEAVNLIKQQRAFQGAAKLVSAIDDMMKTVLDMVG